MRRFRKRGSLLVEAAILLPLTLSAVLLLATMIRLDRMQIETFHSIENTAISAQNVSAFYKEQGEDNQTLSKSCEWNIPVPFFSRTVRFTEFVKYYPFAGDSGTNAFGPDLLEQEGGLVWVFPNRGECYHTSDCMIIKSDPKRVLLTKEIQKKYSPCTNCKSGTLCIGEPVYVFPSGESYHRGTCGAVNRYMKSMPIEKAMEGGYRPCQYCR